MARSLRTAVRTTAFAAVTVAAGLALTACSGSSNPFDDHQEKSDYKTGAEAKKDRKSVPRWLPDNASDIKYVMSTTGDDRLIATKLDGGKLPAECKPGKAQGKPKLEADWFPKDVASKADTNCGTWSGAKIDDTFYAWQDQDVVLGKVKGGKS